MSTWPRPEDVYFDGDPIDDLDGDPVDITATEPHPEPDPDENVIPIAAAAAVLITAMLVEVARVLLPLCA